MSRSWIQQGDVYKPNYINDTPPTEVIEVAAKLDEFIAFASEKSVTVSIEGNAIRQSLTKYKYKVKPDDTLRTVQTLETGPDSQ